MATEEKELKPHSTPLTLQWLEENYELGDGVCIPRSALYVHYMDFCRKFSFDPVNAASFGKIIRQQFPQITTRRLGTRGQSKYHYYGIAIKESSAYFEPGYAKKSAKPGTESAHETKQSWVFSPRSKIGTRLPDLPLMTDLVVPQNVEREKLVTFVMMYQTHCQRILDIVIRANFDEIKTYLIHFWHGLPVHIHDLLVSDYVARLIAYCDLLLYRTVCSVVVPSSQQIASESFIQNLKKFANSLVSWLVEALQKTPPVIRAEKLKYATRFSNHILRQISQNSLISAARNVLQSSDAISHILDDLGPLDLDLICRQTASLSLGNQNEAYEVMMRVFQDLENVLEEQLTLEDFCTWLSQVMDKETSELQSRVGCGPASAARQHLLMWTFFSSRVMQELLFLGAESYGSCQLLSLFLEQYTINHVDEMMFQVDTQDALRVLTGQAAGPPSGGDEGPEAFRFEMAPGFGAPPPPTAAFYGVVLDGEGHNAPVFADDRPLPQLPDCGFKPADAVRYAESHPARPPPVPALHPPPPPPPPPPPLTHGSAAAQCSAGNSQLYSFSHPYGFWDVPVQGSNYYSVVNSPQVPAWCNYGQEAARPPDLQHV